MPPREPRARDAADRDAAAGAAAHDATPAQVALAWLVRKPNVVAIPGASSLEQLRHNVAAADLDLTDDEAEELTGQSDRFTPIPVPAAGLAMLRARRSAP